MMFKHIRVSNLRVISRIELEPGPAVNVISGNNGSGKTSLLEAIYLFGRGISFKEKRLKSIIKDGEECLVVRGLAQKSDRRSTIIVRKTGYRTDVSVNSQKIAKLSTLARLVPIHIAVPNIQYLFEGEAVYRRRLVDWGLFHVEPGFEHLYRRYQRALTQRNTAIRNKDISYIAWEPELCTLSIKLNDLRKKFFGSLLDNFSNIVKDVSFGVDTQLNWKSGWNHNYSIEEVYQRNRESDFNRGFTQAGAHRSDFRVTVQGEPIARRASRGEQKLIAIMMLLAQNKAISAAIGDAPILLIDDFPSELDENNRRILVSRLNAMDHCQIFITTLDSSLVQDVSTPRMFHVEHGVVSSEGV